MIINVLIFLFIIMLFITLHLMYSNKKPENKFENLYDFNYKPQIYITGDKHRYFEGVKQFCKIKNTRKEDILIILGDSGFNYFEDERDEKLKKEISQLNITLFCIHGNKEKRAETISTYGIRDCFGGKVLYEPKYPNIFFAIDGQIYNFNGKQYITIGGAHSVDKLRCLELGYPYWDDEMPSDEIKNRVTNILSLKENNIYGILTHTCPLKYIPTEMFVSTRQNAEIKKNPKIKKKGKNSFFTPDIDRSTEEWLDELEKRINYKVWFSGHYHIDKEIDKLRMMYKNIRPLDMDLEKYEDDN